MDFTWNKGEAFDISFSGKKPSSADGYYGEVIALNVATRKIAWVQKHRAPESSSTLATAGGVLFEGGRDRIFRASNSASGDILWQARLDNVPSSTPITFAVAGIQYVALTTGGGNAHEAAMQSATPEIRPAVHATTLWVFKLAPDRH
jgi:alcohol dehydrogenase (cytochrome c)